MLQWPQEIIHYVKLLRSLLWPGLAPSKKPPYKPTGAWYGIGTLVPRVPYRATWTHARILAEGFDGAKVLEMFLFRCKSCLNNITRCFMKFEARWTTPVVWAEIQFKYWHWMFTYWATTLYPRPLFTSKQEYFFCDQESFDMLKTRFGENLDFHPFWHPFCWFFKGKWAKMGYLANYCSVLPHFCCNDILYWNVDYSYEKDTNRVSWWDMTHWWWKVGVHAAGD